MKKILFMIPCFSQGGVEHSLITAIKNLPTELFDVSVFIRTDETELISELPSWVHVIKNKKCHPYRNIYALLMMIALKVCHFVRLYKIESVFKTFLDNYVHEKKIKFPVKTVLKGKEYDVVISYTVDDCTEIACLIPAKKRYVFYHTPYVDFKKEMIEEKMKYYDGMIACGPGVYHELISLYGENKYNIELLSNYVDRNEIINKSKMELPEKYKNINTDLLLCTCGRIAPAKRYDLAIEGADILNRKGIDFVWILVGGGARQEEFESLIIKKNLSDRVIITGNQNNPYPFIDKCDIYVQTSEFEAQPLTIIEALKLGKIVVSTETLGGKTILENGKKGVLTPITAEGIVDGIEKVINNKDKYSKLVSENLSKEDEKEKKEYSKKWTELLNR